MEHLQYAYVDDYFVSYGLQDEPAEAVVMVGGWPSGEPSKEKAEFFHEKGYHVFLYQYRGLYRSHGEFLERCPSEGITRVCEQLREGVLHNLYFDEDEEFTITRLHLMGGSFGGCALGSAPEAHPDTLTLFAPVWNFSTLAQDGGEDLSETMGFVERAFQHVYRYSFDDIQERLQSFKKLTPEYYADKIECPVLVLHDPADDVVPYLQTQRMRERMDFSIIEHAYGHGTSDALEAYWDQIKNFLA